MARKHFDTLWLPGALFNVNALTVTPTDHNSASFRLRTIRAPHVLSLDIWTGFGNGDKHAGSATPSADPREAVPASDPTRSGRAVRDGWQPVAVVNTDAMTADFVTRSVNDSRFVSHVAMSYEAAGYTISGVDYAVTLFGAEIRPTTLSRTGVPHSGAFRNTDANKATHRAKARERGNALMEHGRRKGGE